MININPKNLKYVQVSQHWGSKKGKKVGDQFVYVNPLTDEGKNKITSMADLETLIEFHQWKEDVHYKFTNDNSAGWGTELYEVNGTSLSLVSTNYDSSD